MSRKPYGPRQQAERHAEYANPYPAGHEDHAYISKVLAAAWLAGHKHASRARRKQVASTPAEPDMGAYFDRIAKNKRHEHGD